jgi:hypothetical protein
MTSHRNPGSSQQRGRLYRLSTATLCRPGHLHPCVVTRSAAERSVADMAALRQGGCGAGGVPALGAGAAALCGRTRRGAAYPPVRSAAGTGGACRPSDRGRRFAARQGDGLTYERLPLPQGATGVTHLRNDVRDARLSRVVEFLGLLSRRMFGDSPIRGHESA